MQFYIGDPKQAIFSFRGADIFTYMSASSKVDNTYTLSTNYRSCPELVNSVNALFGNSLYPFLYSNIAFCHAQSLASTKTMEILTPGSSPSAMQIWLKTQQRGAAPSANAAQKEIIANAVAGEISRLLQSTAGTNARLVSGSTTIALEPSHIAILVRSHAEASLMQDTCSSYSINSTIDSDASVFTSSQSFDLELILQAIIEPATIPYVKAALTSELMMQTAQNIDALSLHAESMNNHLTSFFRYNNMWHSSGIMPMLQTFLSREQVRERLLATVKGDRSITNILHLCELLHKQEKEHALSPSRLFAWYQKKRREKDGQTADDELMRIESDENAVHIVTIHKSKGLEYPVVFSPFSWSSSTVPNIRKNTPVLYHDTTSNNSPVLCIGNKEIGENRHLVEREMLAENLRLLYVALTRAKARCYFILCDTTAFETSAPAYLLHAKDNSEHAVSSLQATMLAPPVATKTVCEQLAEKLSGALCVTEIQTLPTPLPLQRNIEQKQTLSCRQSPKAIPDTWRVSSFTSLSHRTIAEGKARELYDTTSIPEIPDNTALFPKGAITGVFFHDVLEHCDFAKPLDHTLVQNTLNEYGFAQSLLPIAVSMLDNCIQTTLPLQSESNFCFAKLPLSACLKEMGFYFPLKKIVPNDLLSLFSGSISMASYATLLANESPKKLVFSPTQGFLKGFIDLVFEHNDQYFLVDWKTNFLGANPLDYSSANIAQAMNGEHYILQYHLYLTALHTYLSQRVKNYSYDDHMGQVLYIFLRGLQKETTEGTGIFSDRPERKFVEEMCRILIDI
jgi:exodeoxyribonuclease V beta subunit